MMLHEKIGQMLLLGWQGAGAQGVNAQAAALVDELAAGGVIVFTRNVGTPEELRETITSLQARSLALGAPPLFVAVDQEGGRVSRLGPPHFFRPPSAREVGRTGDPGEARAAARAIAGQLRPLGLNWDFAPVLDVNNNPRNPVIGDRSYGDDPQLVAAMGIAAVRGFQEDGGILACGKHFPGHGDTDTDSHLALPRIAHGRDRLGQVELVPFRAAIAAGLAAIMTAHILFPALDPALPATLSPRILTGLLREELDFQGLIITDCLEMQGVARGWGTPEAGMLAVEAGADILLCCHTWETQCALRDALVRAVRDGRISEARIDESVARIAAAKAKWVA
ncbi:MAG: beta-N-acetylhexosaminidase [Armatimonadetes bacterium]|nr:beta-N-acetylhexosaminidase [Armatimonadota bacterium]